LNPAESLQGIVTKNPESSLVIREATVTPIAVPDPPLLNCVGVHEPWALRSIIQLHCDDGVVGLGESYGDADFVRLLEAVAESVVGADVFDLNAVRARVDATVGDRVRRDAHGLTGDSSSLKTRLSAYSSFEVACLDAQGRALDRPVCDLLGGAARRDVPFAAYLFYKLDRHPGGKADAWGEALDPESIVAQARDMIGRFGFRSIKLKGGVHPPKEEIEAIRALREAFPTHPLRLDPNAAWQVSTAVEVAASLDGFLEYLEDPTPGLAGMAEVARRTPMPLATNMCVVSWEDIPEAIRLGAVSIVLSDHHFWGGLRLTQSLSTLCQTFGLGLSMHSNTHLGVSLAAMVHLGAATPYMTYALDTHYPWLQEDVVVGGKLPFAGGAVSVPEGPGLGVEVDQAVLARMNQAYLDCGLVRRDDTGYMRQIEPKFQPNTGRW
jgi:glucarate dehydratase